ncbi:antifreeze protein [Mycena rebaudengoi]|nr:antifreeze protein [Mycena rebaudengoi]
MLSFTTSTVLITLLSIVNGAVALGPAAVNLRTAGNFAILSKAGVSTIPPSSIIGDIGVSPIAATGLTGFSLTLDPTGTFSTSTQVVGKLYAASYNAPTPAKLTVYGIKLSKCQKQPRPSRLPYTVAIGDMVTAFNNANGLTPPDFTPIGNIGGMTLTPGLYKWTGAVSATSDFTISGTSTDTWIFQVASTLNISAGKKAILAGGALKSNIVWVVSGSVTVAAGAHLEGVILGKTSVSFLTGASLNGRILAQTSEVKFLAQGHGTVGY